MQFCVKVKGLGFITLGAGKNMLYIIIFAISYLHIKVLDMDMLIIKTRSCSTIESGY